MCPPVPITHRKPVSYHSGDYQTQISGKTSLDRLVYTAWEKFTAETETGGGGKCNVFVVCLFV